MLNNILSFGNVFNYITGRDVIKYTTENDPKLTRLVSLAKIFNIKVIKIDNSLSFLEQDEKIKKYFNSHNIDKKVIFIVKSNPRYQNLIDLYFNLVIVFEKNTFKVTKNRFGEEEYDISYKKLYKDEIYRYEDFFGKNIENFEKEELDLLEMKYSV